MTRRCACNRRGYISEKTSNGEKRSDTTKKLRGGITGKGFMPGFDPKRNLKGRPKSFDAVRELAQQIAHQTEANKLTAIENVLREWRDSSEPALQKAFVEYAFGKVPDKIESDVNLKTKHVLHWPHERPDLVNGNRN